MFALFKDFLKEQHERELAGKEQKEGDEDEEKENGLAADKAGKRLSLVDRIVLENRRKAAQADSKSRISKFPLSVLSGVVGLIIL